MNGGTRNRINLIDRLKPSISMSFKASYDNSYKACFGYVHCDVKQNI